MISGVAPLFATRALKCLKIENHDQQVGIDIIRRVLEAPARQIAINAGYDGATRSARQIKKILAAPVKDEQT